MVLKQVLAPWVRLGRALIGILYTRQMFRTGVSSPFAVKFHTRYVLFGERSYPSASNTVSGKMKYHRLNVFLK